MVGVVGAWDAIEYDIATGMLKEGGCYEDVKDMIRVSNFPDGLVCGCSDRHNIPAVSEIRINCVSGTAVTLKKDYVISCDEGIFSASQDSILSRLHYFTAV